MLLSLLLFITRHGQLSVCAPYDLEKPPEEVRVFMFIKCMHKGDTLYVDGAIDPYLIYELTVFAPEPIKKISLNSSGGLVDDAVEVAEWVRQNNIEVFVRKDAICMSACTLIFQAGTSAAPMPMLYSCTTACAIRRAPRTLKKKIKTASVTARKTV